MIIVKVNKNSLFKQKANLPLPLVRMSTCVVNKASNKCTIKQTNMTGKCTKFSDKNETDDNFVIPPKRKLIASSVSQPKRYVLDPDQLFKENPYQVLSEHSYASSASNVNNAEDMDDSVPDDQQNIQKSKPPPIFLHNVNNHQEIVKDVKKVTKASFTTQVRGQSLKVNLSNIDDYRSLTAFYDTSGIKYHTFQTHLDKKLQVVVRNVPTSLSDSEIKTELTDQNYPVLRVSRLLNKNKMPLPLCAIDLENNDDGKSIFKLDTLCFAVVSVEPKRKSRQLPQCTRCQRFGHTKNFCKLDPRCVRCTGLHHYSACPKNKSETPQCINCGENHTANYRGCMAYQEIVKTKTQTKINSNLLPRSTKETPSIPDINSSSHFPKIQENSDTVRASPKMRVSYARSAASTPSDNTPDSNVNDQSDTTFSQSLERIILDIVKSFLPALKKIINNVISNVLTHGSI